MSIKYKDYIRTEICDNRDLSIIRILKILFYSPEKEALFLLRTFLYLSGNKKANRIRLYCRKRLIYKFGIYINSNAVIGIGLKLPHPTGIVIGNSTIIGDNNIIYQNVTFGRKNIDKSYANTYPRSSSDCVFFANSVVLGKINIAQGTILGANSILINDTVKNGVYAGVPATLRKIKNE